MKRLLIVSVGSFAIIAGLNGCQTTDAQIAKINASVQNYCAVIKTAGDIAQTLDNKPLVTKINNGLGAYCSGPVTDVPSALLALAKIYKAVNDAGIPVASN